MSFATECIDRLHSTAASHRRVMVVEVMGRYAGWIALNAGISGTADVILIPEIPYDLKSVAEKIAARFSQGHNFAIVVVAEGARPKGGELLGDREEGRGARRGSAARARRWRTRSASAPAATRATWCSATCCAAARRPPSTA